MPDCWRFMYPVSYGLQKHSLFKNVLDSKILFIREAGLVGKWFKDELSVIGVNKKKGLRDGKLTMTAMQVPFLFLIMCLTVIFAAWGGEWIWHKRSIIRVKCKGLKVRDSMMKMAMPHRRNKPLTATQASHPTKISVVATRTIPLKDIIITLPSTTSTSTSPRLPGAPTLANGLLIQSSTPKSNTSRVIVINSLFLGVNDILDLY